uniref:RGS domain-containing protein n=1 Tax=Parastrongyloides trichosuri TaxID=131310 RepID=A0A0N4ZCU2_PARTI
FPGRHRRHRHGAEHGRGPCGLCGPAEVRRAAHALAARRGDRPDRRAGRASPARRHVRRHGRGRGTGRRPGRTGGRAPLRPGRGGRVAQREAGFRHAARPAALAYGDAEPHGLRLTAQALDETLLRRFAVDEDVRKIARSRGALMRLWEAYRPAFGAAVWGADAELHRQPARLDGGGAGVARPDEGAGGTAQRRAARTADGAFRRSAHGGPDAGAERALRRAGGRGRGRRGHGRGRGGRSSGRRLLHRRCGRIGAGRPGPATSSDARRRAGGGAAAGAARSRRGRGLLRPAGRRGAVERGPDRAHHQRRPLLAARAAARRVGAGPGARAGRTAHGGLAGGRGRAGAEAAETPAPRDRERRPDRPAARAGVPADRGGRPDPPTRGRARPGGPEPA